jgi:DNA (cytosine-5)-methyltransferase 1
MFHARWFEHSSKTVLAETANPQALFLTDICDDNEVDSILQKITVKYIEDGKEPLDPPQSEIGSQNFHFRCVICLHVLRMVMSYF